VEEDEAAVDEGPEVDRPAHPHFVLLHVVARGQPHLRGVVLARHRKETVRAREVDDLAVVGRRLPRHPRAVPELQGARKSPLREIGGHHTDFLPPEMESLEIGMYKTTKIGGHHTDLLSPDVGV
jgi:hypothetical protein